MAANAVSGARRPALVVDAADAAMSVPGMPAGVAADAAVPAGVDAGPVRMLAAQKRHDEVALVSVGCIGV